ESQSASAPGCCMQSTTWFQLPGSIRIFWTKWRELAWPTRMVKALNRLRRCGRKLVQQESQFRISFVYQFPARFFPSPVRCSLGGEQVQESNSAVNAGTTPSELAFEK